MRRLTNQSSSLNAKQWPRLPLKAVIHTDPKGCILSATCLGQRAGSDSETASVIEAIRKQEEILKDQATKGSKRARDFYLVVAEVGLVLETALKNSLYISLAIESLAIMYLWVDAYGTRDISAIISCQGTTLAELRIVFLEKGLESSGCLLPVNLTRSR